MAWDPTQYLKFSGERLQPALDLIARVPLAAPGTIVDLGCGAGNVARVLAARWPDAALTGVDSSAEMLAKARVALPTARWVEADIGSYRPAVPPDLLFSNAALHWLDDHAALFPRILAQVKPGGAFAVQMPRNHGAPSHRAMADAARQGPWAEALAPVLRESPVAEPAFYYDLLRPLTKSLDIWETEYLHVLEGDNPVVAWTKGTALKPLLDALREPRRGAFEAEYAKRIRAAYPPRADGRTLFPFRRLFILARM